jgi:hypothetical protein
LLAVLETWGEDPLETYQSTIASKPDPDDPRLAIPHNNPLPRDAKTPSPSSPATDAPIRYEDSQSNFVKLPDGASTSVLKVMQTLTGILDMQDRPHCATVYKQCFVNTEAVTAIQTHYQMKTRDEAVAFGRHLQELKILDHVCEDHVFKDDGYL